MRRVRILALLLACSALAAATPALATSVTVQISGTWSSVTDSAGVLDGSVTVGGSFTATLVYDDATLDSDPSVEFGGYDVPAMTSDLSVVTGNYSFSPGSGVGIGVENDNAFGEDWIFLFAENYVGTGPFPVGVGTGATAYANPTLVDFSASAHGSDALVGLNWNLGNYDDASFYLFVEITGQGPLEFLEFQGTITDIQVLPEPSMLCLTALALAALAAHRRG
jgi:hypothetical protein